MTPVDATVLIIVLFCVVMGAYWGVIRQALAIAGVIAGLALASLHTGEIADLLSSFVVDYALARVLAFVLILLSVSCAASLLASLLQRFVGLLFLGWLDHLLGAGLGLAQGVLICTTALILAAGLPNPLWTPLVLESQVAPALVQTVGALVLAFLPEPLRLGADLILAQ